MVVLCWSGWLAGGRPAVRCGAVRSDGGTLMGVVGWGGMGRSERGLESVVA